MKKLLVLLVLVLAFNLSSAQNEFGMSLSFGSIDVSNDYYSKSGNFAFGVGVLGILNERVLVSTDFIFKDLGAYDNTGVNGSNSTFEKFDSSVFLFRAKGGYLITNTFGILLGGEIGSLNIYEVMRGYSNLTAYDYDKSMIIQPVVAILVKIGKGKDFTPTRFYFTADKSFGENPNIQGGVGMIF